MIYLLIKIHIFQSSVSIFYNCFQMFPNSCVFDNVFFKFEALAILVSVPSSKWTGHPVVMILTNFRVYHEVCMTIYSLNALNNCVLVQSERCVSVDNALHNIIKMMSSSKHMLHHMKWFGNNIRFISYGWHGIQK